MTTRRSPSAGLRTVIQRMLNHPNQIVKAWGRRVEAAYWHDQQIPLIPDNDKKHGEAEDDDR